MPLEHPHFCEIFDKMLYALKTFQKILFLANLRLCLKYGQSQPKRAYKAHAYNKKCVSKLIIRGSVRPWVCP